MNRELQTIIVEVEKAVVGKREVIEKILMALLADGHVLLDDIPGVGKTTYFDTHVPKSACLCTTPANQETAAFIEKTAA